MGDRLGTARCCWFTKVYISHALTTKNIYDDVLREMNILIGLGVVYDMGVV